MLNDNNYDKLLNDVHELGKINEMLDEFIHRLYSFLPEIEAESILHSERTFGFLDKMNNLRSDLENSRMSIAEYADFLKELHKEIQQTLSPQKHYPNPLRISFDC